MRVDTVDVVDVVAVEVVEGRDLFGSAGVVDVPARGDEVTALATRRQPRAGLPAAWKGIDATRPVLAEDIPTIQAAFEAWIGKNVAPRKRAPSPQTVRAYLGDSQQFLEWLVQQELDPLPEWFNGPEALWDLWERLDGDGETGIPLLLVTPQVAQSYMEHLVSPGHGGTSGSNEPRAEDGSYSPATLGKKRSSLNTFFTFTRKGRLTFGNPLEDMDEVIRTPQDNRSAVERIKALTRPQAERLLAAIMGTFLTSANADKKTAAIRDRVMIELMMLQGLRNIEVHRLNLEDYIPNAHGEQGTLRLLGKGDKQRTVALRPEMQEELNLWLQARALGEFNETALFVNLHGVDAGKRLSQRSIRERVDVYLEKTGLKREGISCHALRHTYATLYFEAKGKDANKEVLAQSMGHSDSKITSVYIDWVDMFAENPSEPLMEIHTAAARRAEDDARCRMQDAEGKKQEAGCKRKGRKVRKSA